MKANKFLLLIFSLLMIHSTLLAQEAPEEQKEVVNLHYFNNNNSVQYLLMESFLKTGKKSEPQANKVFQLYLDSNNAANLITKVMTNADGKAKAVIPPQLKSLWEASPEHKFLVVAEGTSKEEETTTEFAITKAKIALDTATGDGVRSITASVMKLQNNEWVPAADVELKLGIERMGGILPAGDEPTYTTDSTGTATCEFKRDSLPGDLHGNIILAARVEDNDELGNLLIEKPVPWGIAEKQNNLFFSQRALWATHHRTPLWLLLMAYSIGLGVWGTIIYLIFQLVKIKKLGISYLPQVDEEK